MIKAQTIITDMILNRAFSLVNNMYIIFFILKYNNGFAILVFYRRDITILGTKNFKK